MDQMNQFVSLLRDEFPEDRLTYQKQIPTFHPESAEEAARFVTLANQHKQGLFIAGFGNNVEPVGQSFENLVTMKTDRLNRMIEINTKDLYVTTGSGYPLREINYHLKDQDLFVPHAELPYAGSVGGALAVDLSASMYEHDVPLSRYFLKAEIVTPEGEIITPGSICFKSVSGYDIVKIYAGSWGLLGVIISASFRVMPDTARDDYTTMRQKPVDRTGLIAALDEDSADPNAVYSRKIKKKFDPNNILPIV